MLPTDSSMLSVHGAAKALGRSPDTVRRYIRDGRLPAYKAGEGSTSSLRIPAAAVTALLEAGRVRPKPRTGVFRDRDGDIFAVPGPVAG